MASHDDIDGWMAIVERVVAWFAIVGGCVAVFWARVRRLCFGLSVAADLHLEFGANAAKQIRKLLDDLHSAKSVEEIRQTIAERHLGLGIYLCDASGSCTFATDVLAESFGIDHDDMRGYGWIAAISPEQQLTVHNKWITAIEHALPYEAECTVVNRRTGEQWQARTRAVPLKRDGQVYQFIGWVVRES